MANQSIKVKKYVLEYRKIVLLIAFDCALFYEKYLEKKKVY